jgi:hypothetical protein
LERDSLSQSNIYWQEVVCLTPVIGWKEIVSHSPAKCSKELECFSPTLFNKSLTKSPFVFAKWWKQNQLFYYKITSRQMSTSELTMTPWLISVLVLACAVLFCL